MSDESDWDKWLETIAREGVNLTTWEEDFVESMQDRRSLGRQLTENMAKTLERIYAERTS